MFGYNGNLTEPPMLVNPVDKSGIGRAFDGLESAAVNLRAVEKTDGIITDIFCPDCGMELIRLGACFACPTCGFGSCG